MVWRVRVRGWRIISVRAEGEDEGWRVMCARREGDGVKVRGGKREKLCEELWD